MGRNNKRMKSEMMSKMKMQYQQQQAAVYAAPAFNHPFYSWPYSMLQPNPTVASAGITANVAAAAAAAIPRYGNRSNLYKCLVWFVTDATQLLCQDLLRSRKLCQSPYSQVTAVTAESFRQPVLDVFLTPQYAN